MGPFWTPSTACYVVGGRFHAFGHRVAFEEVRSQIGKGGDQFMPVFMTHKEIDEYAEDLESERPLTMPKPRGKPASAPSVCFAAGGRKKI
jgi:hypothetical protein